MREFAWFYQRALELKGGEQALAALLPVPLTAPQLRALSDAHCLSQMSLRIFRAGLKHEMVDAKWPAFEEVFLGFEPLAVAHMSDEQLEALMQDKRIIRHWGKLKSVRHNALMCLDIIEEAGSLGNWLADWPGEQIVELWLQLKKRGNGLGGASAARFLRMLGKDSFQLSEDVVFELIEDGIISKMPSSQKDLRAVQNAFNHWQQQAQLPYCQVSRIISINQASD